ncbi:MAG: GGDEF domain-containing protein [Candidatus Aminicenantes bacterium]|nr:GGDEF domain-containing protein [Candidatus Aminicenantes bacterium]
MTRGQRTRRKIRLALFVLIFLPAAARAEAGLPLLSVSADTPVIEVAPNSEYLLDPSNALTYEEIIREKPPFQRHRRDSFRFSFRKASLWIRCRIASGVDGGEVAAGGPVLALANPILGSITLYVPVVRDGATGIVEMKGGWREDMHSQEIPFLYPAFALPGDIDTRRPLLIQVIAPFTLNFRVLLHTPESFRSSGSLLFLIIGAFTGILGAMLLYNLVLYAYMRDRHYLFYILYVLFMLLWQAALFGIFRYFSSPWGRWFNLRVVIFASFMLFFGTVFAIVFLNTAKTAPRHHSVLKALAVCALAVALINLLGHATLANLLAHFLAQFSALAVCTAAVAALRSGFKPARFYLVAVSVVLAAALVYFLRFYGLLSSNQFTLHAVLYGGAAEAVLLSFALGHRIRLMRQEEETLRLREKSLQAISVTDDLTGLYNRRFLNASLEKGVAAARRSTTPLSLLMLDVDRFKGFNDAYGHPEGDKVLAALGRLLALTLREEDIACRYGGEEFAIILQHADLVTALEAAERIRSRFAETPFFPTKEKTARLTVSIGAAQLRSDEDAGRLLMRADQALYEAKRSGRDRVCSA